MQNLKLTTKGFKLWFTKQIKKKSFDSKKIKIRSFRYEYGYRYGSSEKDKKEHQIVAVNGTGPFEIIIDELVAGRIYERNKPELTSEDNQKIHDPFVQYTVNRLKRPETKFPAKLNLQEDG